MSKSNWLRRLSAVVAGVAMVGAGSVSSANAADVSTYRYSTDISGGQIVSHYATRQFNNALGQVFADRFIANVATDAEVCPGLTSFVKAYGGFGSEGNRGDRAGYDLGNVGVFAGVGYQFGKELEVGGLIGYSYNSADSFKKSGSSGALNINDFHFDITDNVLRLGLYGNYSWNNLFFNTAPTFGIHFVDGEEVIRGTSAGVPIDRSRSIRESNTGFDFSWYNRVGYVFELPKDFLLTPSYSLAMTYYDYQVRSYNIPYNNWSLLQTLDVRVGRLFHVSDCFALLPEFIAGWEHEYINPGSFYSVPMRAIAQDRAILGVGLSTIIAKKYEVSARYDERLWGDGHNSNFTVGLSVKF